MSEEGWDDLIPAACALCRARPRRDDGGGAAELPARSLSPTAQRRGAFWGRRGCGIRHLGDLPRGRVAEPGALPTVTEFWTGTPIITGLPGPVLAAVMLPSPLPANVGAASEAQTPTGS